MDTPKRAGFANWHQGRFQANVLASLWESVSRVVGYIKGKSAIHIARAYAGDGRSFVGQNFWARGYYLSTTGRDEETIRSYIKTKKRWTDKTLDQRRTKPMATREQKWTLQWTTLWYDQ
ncbi:MAG: transposase [Deltaproteobacteria bacterium]|nr:MAG: transposase [Deltaproteobacteria bacterium]